MAVTSLVVGAVTSVSATVVAKIAGTSATLVVAEDASLSPATATATAAADAQGVAKLTVTGLAPDLQYYYGVRDDGVLDTTTTGRFTTYPAEGAAASYRIACIGDAGQNPTYPGDAGGEMDALRVSNSPTFDHVYNQNALATVHLGDLHYYDIGSGVYTPDDSITTYRTAYDDVLAQSRQHRLYRDRSWLYVWDDHDFGPNDSDGTLAGKANAAQAYRERVPHYPVPASGPVYQSVTIGRVLWVLLDPRYNRDPQANPDGASHTMLGADQKTWLRGLLETTSAEAMVLVSGVHWIIGSAGASGAWGGYATERDEVAAMLTSTTVPASGGSRTWAESMVMVCADAHMLALWSGPANAWGGFAGMGCAAIDADAGPADLPQFDLGYQLGRDQHGTVDVADDGEAITLTLTGWYLDSPWGSHAVTVSTAHTPDPAGPVAPDVGVAVEQPHVEFWACNLATGEKLAYLPGTTGTISRSLGAYTSDTLTVPAPLAGQSALGSLLGQALGPDQLPTRMVVCAVNDVPAWAGIIWKVRGGSGGTVELGCATPEYYLDRRYVGDLVFEQTDQASLVAALAEAANVEGIGLEIDAPASAVLRDRTYYDDDDATYYQRLTELMDVDGGPEWTIDVDWRTTAQQAVRLILRVADRIGSTEARGPLSARSAAVTSYEVTYDYGKDAGANDVLAYSSGEGEDRPESQHQRDEAAIAQGVPRVEHRWSPSSSITDTAVLDEHATAKLRLLGAGTTSMEITARWNVAPARLGLDMVLGDDVAYDLVGHLHPDGLTGTARMVGWRLDTVAGTFQPVLRM